MSRICVATEKGREYYVLVSRLRRAGLPFTSVLPDSDLRGCTVILTTASEAKAHGEKALAIESLDENPGVFKGQVVSRLQGGAEPILVGVDPGTRTGMAVFYGEEPLAFGTFNSVASLCSEVGAFWRGVPGSSFLVRIGNGNPTLAMRIAEAVSLEVPEAAVETVDESGTSIRNPRLKGVQRDQGAAAKIAFRHGEVVSPGRPRTRARGPVTQPG